MQTQGTRDRLVDTMSDALQRRGLHGVGLSDILSAAGVPKGVLYHHFPGGKTELAVAAVELSLARILARLDTLLTADPDPIAALRAWLRGAQAMLDGSNFERGCPLATVTLESTADDVALRGALASAFVAVRGRITASLVAAGREPASAEGLAALIVAAYEGGLLQARAENSLKPMVLATQSLIDLLGATHAVAHASPRTANTAAESPSKPSARNAVKKAAAPPRKPRLPATRKGSPR